MANLLKKRRHQRRRQRGQTVIEWLLLTALCFVAGYIIITRPVALGTELMLTTVKSAMANMIQNGSVRPGGLVTVGEGDHPGSPTHFRPLHN